MELVALDSMVVLWGVLSQGKESDAPLIERAGRFIRSLDERNATVLIPSIVVGELMAGLAPNLHEAFLKTVGSRFVVAPYDLPAAAEYARLWRERHADGVLKGILEEPKSSRSRAMADAMVLAPAIARKATAVYSHDEPMARMAGDRIRVLKMPLVVEQTVLPFPPTAVPKKGTGQK